VESAPEKQGKFFYLLQFLQELLDTDNAELCQVLVACSDKANPILCSYLSQITKLIVVQYESITLKLFRSRMNSDRSIGEIIPLSLQHSQKGGVLHRECSYVFL
jgi:hypothetical protein